MNYYISDMHLGHRNVLRFDDRPFENVEEMDGALITNWNAKVTKDDDVWILGDFSYCSDREASFYLKQLKGRKHLIIGNHDKILLESQSALDYLESVERLQHIKDRNYNVIMCHFPLATWNGISRGSYHIYGHIHNDRNEVFEFMKKRKQALNAGCMINNYEPVTLEELIENNRKFQEIE